MLSSTADDPPSSDVAPETHHPAVDGSEPKERFDALVRDRDSLRAEVTDMRKSLEEIQSKHEAEMEALQQKLDDTETKKEQAETQFQQLLQRVNTIKSQLGERLKEDAVRGIHWFDTTDFCSHTLNRKSWLTREPKSKISRMRTQLSSHNWISSLQKYRNLRRMLHKRTRRSQPFGIGRTCPSKTGSRRRKS